MLFVDIESAIENIASDVELLQPLYEAIVNSVHAKAKNINITINQQDDYISSFAVIDDGEGYVPSNIKSFSTLWSKIKQEPGALGSGRIMYLRVFEYVTVESYTGTHKVTFKFDRNFDPKNIKKELSNEPKKTITIFHNLLEEYIKKERFIIDKIKEKIFHELLPMFSRIWQEEKDIAFIINHETWINKDNIAEQFGKMELQSTDFEITPFNGVLPEKFILFYNIKKDSEGKILQFYGAAGRKVRNFSSGVSIRKLPENASGIFCLTGRYLDDRVKDNRKDFKISTNESNISQTHPISFTQINGTLQIKLNEIILEAFPNYETNFENKKQVLIDEYPHLSEYIDQVNNLTYDDDEIIEEAKEMLEESFKKTEKALFEFKKEITTKRDFDEDKFNKILGTFTKTGRDQLASYIAYRQTILDMMQTIAEYTNIDKQKFNETSIHQLFMPKNTTSDNYPHLGTNIWMLDDKFMSYLYAASDKEIKSIKEKFKAELIESGESPEDVNDGDKPDLVLFYSDSNESSKKDVLLIELKKYGATYHEKIKAITQLKVYASVIFDNIKNIRSIHAYTIIDIDERFATYLTRTEAFYEDSLSNDETIASYYAYNSHIHAHLHVMSFEQIVVDAKKRNKVFLDILKRQHS